MLAVSYRACIDILCKTIYNDSGKNPNTIFKGGFFMNHQNEGKVISGNALVIYGGGLCDNAARFITDMAQALYRSSNSFEKVFVGRFSFRALTEDDSLIEEWTEESSAKYEDVLGGYFGTCRETDLANDEQARKRAFDKCKRFGIRYIFLGGGDGSARQMAEIAELFKEQGIYFVFALPLTIDGIEGGNFIGLRAAVNVSLHRIDEVSSTGLRTLEGNKYPALAVKLMGRNRDNILAEVMTWIDANGIRDFGKDEVEIKAIPANYPWSKENLIEAMKVEGDPNGGKLIGKPLLILYSEGAKLGDVQLEKNDLKEMAANAGRKLRFFSIGHNSQINGETTDLAKDVHRNIVNDIAEKALNTIHKNMSSNTEEPFSIVVSDSRKSLPIRVEKYDYFAKLNPRERQKPTLEKNTEKILKKYIP